MTRPGAWLARTAEGYVAVLRSENLRRSQVAWAGGVTAEFAFFVGLSVFVFEEQGIVGVGLVGLIRMVPAALVAPFVSLFGDRYRRDRVVLGLFLAMAAAVAVAALVAFAAPPTSAIYALAALHSGASTLSRSAQWALLPAICRTPAELVAANSSTLTTESLGMLVGPALGGVVLAGAGPGTLFALCAGLYLVSAAALGRIRSEEASRPPTKRGRRVRELLSGFPALFETRALTLVVALANSQALVRGALNVFVAVVALQLFEDGEGGVGFLMAALGAGGLVGAFFALSLTGRRLALPLAAGLVLWGLPLVGIAAVPHYSAALAFIAVIGAGNSVLDVAVFTLLQRLLPNDRLTRALGVDSAITMLAIGVGSITTAGLIEALGIRGALVAVGSFLPVLAILAWRALAGIDRSIAVQADQLDMLTRIPMFERLPLASKGYLASALQPVTVAPGVDVVTEGEAGRRFYIVAEGRVQVSQGGRALAERGPGEYFGEIALLRDIPRTATVTARGELRLYALERRDFLEAVIGHPAAREAGEAIVDERLATGSSGRLRPERLSD